MNNEYTVLVDHFGFTVGNTKQVSLNGIRASFLSLEQKKEFRATISQGI